MTKPIQSLLPISATLLLLALAGSVFAQEPSKRWKNRNDRGNRYEGRIEIPVANPKIELLAILASREPYSNSDELMVRFFVPEPGDLLLEARELEERSQYFMQAKEQEWTIGEWNEWGPWEVRTSLAKENIPPSNLGVLIRSSEDEETTFLPAFIYHSEAPTEIESYTFHVRPGSTLSELTYRVYQGDEELSREELVKLDAFVPFTIRLETAELPEGKLRLELEGKPKGRLCGGNHRPCPGGSYVFYHRPLEEPVEEPPVEEILPEEPLAEEPS